VAFFFCTGANGRAEHARRPRRRRRTRPVALACVHCTCGGRRGARAICAQQQRRAAHYGREAHHSSSRFSLRHSHSQQRCVPHAATAYRASRQQHAGLQRRSGALLQHANTSVSLHASSGVSCSDSLQRALRDALQPRTSPLSPARRARLRRRR
jgi:hypothetical protein